MKKLIAIMLSLVLIITTAGCAANAASSTTEKSGHKSKSSSSESKSASKSDNDDDGDDVDVTPAKTIDKDGEYTLTGDIDGQVLVTAENVTLILDSANISCAEASAILGKDGNGDEVEQNLIVELRGESTITSGAKHGIQSKDDLTITGVGAANISAEKDGLHAGETLTVKDGAVNVLKSYEGMEATNIVISGGTSAVNASDDGINATDDTGKVTPSIKITGGELIVYCTSDGIDSNGTLDVASGSTVAIFIGETRDGDGTDVDREGTIPPTLYGEAQIKAGTAIKVGDLWSFTPTSDVTKYCLMLPGLKDGQSYDITANGAAIATATATTTLQGMQGGGKPGGTGTGGFGGRSEVSGGAGTPPETGTVSEGGITTGKGSGSGKHGSRRGEGTTSGAIREDTDGDAAIV
jgi:hypothetical protein